jgi:hypothetical protein
MSGKRFYKATNAKQVFEKARECRYYLNQMVEHETAGDRDKFMFSVSAYLESFRCVWDRLYGVTEHKFGSAFAKALGDRLKSNSQISFLRELANAELHGDGAVIWPRYTVHITYELQGSWPSRWSSRWDQADRWRSRFESRSQQRTSRTEFVRDYWHFEGNYMNLLELCRKGLDEMDKCIQQHATVVP